MRTRLAATEAKNNFGGLLDLVAARGRVEVTKHGRLVAVVLSPQHLDAMLARTQRSANRAHMIPPAQAREARLIRAPRGFDDE